MRIAAEGLEKQYKGRRVVNGVTFDISQGEIVGLLGPNGAGKTTTFYMITGLVKPNKGVVTFDTKPVTNWPMYKRAREGIGYLPQEPSVFRKLTVADNIILAMQAARGWVRPVAGKRRDELVEEYIKALRIHPANPDALVRNLSGGNQQKVLLARWLITKPRLLILDEPTRGIDIGAKAEIQKLVVALSDEGMSVLFISAELEEVLRLSHKVAVLRDRRMLAELPNDDELTAERIMETIASGANA